MDEFDDVDSEGQTSTRIGRLEVVMSDPRTSVDGEEHTLHATLSMICDAMGVRGCGLIGEHDLMCSDGYVSRPRMPLLRMRTSS